MHCYESFDADVFPIPILHYVDIASSLLNHMTDRQRCQWSIFFDQLSEIHRLRDIQIALIPLAKDTCKHVYYMNYPQAYVSQYCRVDPKKPYMLVVIPVHTVDFEWRLASDVDIFVIHSLRKADFRCVQKLLNPFQFVQFSGPQEQMAIMI